MINILLENKTYNSRTLDKQINIFIGYSIFRNSLNFLFLATFGLVAQFAPE